MADLAASAEDDLRESLRALLDSGLETNWKVRADDDGAVRRTVGALQALAADDYRARLTLAGFTLTPYRDAVGDEQACHTCIYYVTHRRFCALPALQLPVDDNWSCALWRL